MFVDFLNLKKTDQPPTYPPLFENTTQKVKKRKKVPLTQLKNHQKALKPLKSSQLRVGVFHRSETAESHAREPSTAQESHNLKRGSRPPLRNRIIARAGLVYRPEIAESHALEGSTAREMQNSTRGSRPPLKNSIISSAGALHRPEIVVSHAREPSTAQKLPNLTRRSRPPLRNRSIPRAGAVHRSGIAEFHAQESSTAQGSQNPTRRRGPPLRNRSFSRVGWFRYTRTVIKNLIEQFLSQKTGEKKLSKLFCINNQ